MSQFGNQPKIEGEIGYFGLADWWLSTFTKEEREYIERVYQPVIGYEPNSKPLTYGRTVFSTGTATNLLSGLSSWFRKPEDYQIACKILFKAEELGSSHIIDLHFTYQCMIEVFYRMRDAEKSAFDSAVIACEKQIRLAPKAARAFKREYRNSELPAHVGYQQLAIVREKQKDYAGAIELCGKAKEQGWNGDWDKRIERCQAKINKSLK